MDATLDYKLLREAMFSFVDPHRIETSACYTNCPTFFLSIMVRKKAQCPREF